MSCALIGDRMLKASKDKLVLDLLISSRRLALETGINRRPTWLMLFVGTAHSGALPICGLG